MMADPRSGWKRQSPGASSANGACRQAGEEGIGLSGARTGGVERRGNAAGEGAAQVDRINLGFNQHLPWRDVDLLEQLFDLFPFLRRSLHQDGVIELVGNDARS